MKIGSPLAAVCVCLSLSAFAQVPTPNIDIETLYFDPAGQGTLTVGSGATLKQGKFKVGAALGYQFSHLQFSTETSSGDVVVRDRVDAQLFGAVGVTDWLELGATVPVIIQQFTNSSAPFDVAPAGLGTPQLHARFGILDERRPLLLSLGLTAGLPLGSSAALSNQGFWVMPRLNVGRRLSSLVLMAEVSAMIRNNGVSLVDSGGSYWDYLGNTLSVSAAVRTQGPSAQGELTLRLTAPLQQGWVGFEGLLGLRVPLKQTELFIALGPGFSGGPNTPGFRLYLGANFGNQDPPRKPCVEGEPYEIADCPDLDRDGDGVKNALDQCPLQPEDKDGFRDDDGCPDPDNDGDGVVDVNDKCPNEKGLVENQGCPDVDTDHDGIVDRLDKCPLVPEDLDGFEDDDGCPDPDNDGDGVEDTKDLCPNEKGIPEEKGCPAKDTDGDGVPNHLDNCPDVKGVPENGGCPAADKQLVVITRERLRILDQVRFATGHSSILPGSFKMLDQIVAVLKTQSRIHLVQVEGHTDNVGKPEANQKLSQDRANSLRDYLVKKGVAPERLKPLGFGQDRPIESNSTAKGREANRRVEFNILEQD